MIADRPEGLVYIPGYLTEAESVALTAFIDTSPWRNDLKRRVQHYGYVYDYRARKADGAMRLGVLPPLLARLAAGLAEKGCFATPPDQAIVNEYLPGQGISAHTDCVPCFGPVVASLSLDSPCLMDFSHPDGERKHSLLLEPGSLLVLAGTARHDWRHAIAARKSDIIDGRRIPRSRRLSVTFRTMRQP